MPLAGTVRRERYSGQARPKSCSAAFLWRPQLSRRPYHCRGSGWCLKDPNAQEAPLARGRPRRGTPGFRSTSAHGHTTLLVMSFHEQSGDENSHQARRTPLVGRIFHKIPPLRVACYPGPVHSEFVENSMGCGLATIFFSTLVPTAVLSATTQRPREDAHAGAIPWAGIPYR